MGKCEPCPISSCRLWGEAIAGNQAVQEAIKTRTLVRPQADPERCTAYGACVAHCPVSALTLEEDDPEVAAAACITCFCSQEICPEKAMTLT